MDKLKEVISLVYSYDKRIDSARGMIRVKSAERAVVNDLGIECHETETWADLSLCSTAKENNSLAVGFGEQIECEFSRINFDTAALECSASAINQLHPKSIKQGKMNVIMQPHALSEVFSFSLALSLRANQIMENQSPFSGKLNQEIAPECFTLIDDPTVPYGLCTQLFDDEGVPSQRRILIRKGVMQNMLHNTETAIKWGIKYGGNAMRFIYYSFRSFHVEPNIAPTNLLVKPSSKTLQELMDEVEEGIICADCTFAPVSSDVVLGNISIIGEQVFKVRNGNIESAIHPVLIKTNILDLLRSIEDIGGDTRKVFLNMYPSSLISPSILLSDIFVSPMK